MNKNYFRRFMVLLVMLTVLLAPSIIHPASVRAAWLPGWANKVPVTITNTGAALTDYQVQINLDTTNFTFGQANSDGSDIRFTAADGTTLLPYWMESWQYNLSATFWVKLSAVPAGGSVTIYMYYGNSSASSTSNGAATFSFFEDFESTPWTAWTKEVTGIGTFIQSTDRAKRSTHSGKFNQPTGPSASTVFSKASSLPGTNFIQEWDFYDDMAAAPAFKMVRANYQIFDGQIGIGVWTGSSSTYYAYHNTGYGYTPTTVTRSLGWHKMGIRVTSDGNANFFVDGSSSLGNLSGLPTNFNRISVEGLPNGPTTYYVDDFRVRKYASPVPTVVVGVGGPPSVDMAISKTDSPDPLKINEQLTYQITVNNYGDLDATNVTVNDTLPANVNLGSVTPSQGSCSVTSSITCNLGTVLSGGSATITIVVTPTQEGQLSNTATVSCTETDPNPANNSSTATTTVGNPVVYVVNAIDTEAYDDHIMTPQHRPFDLRNFIRATSVYIGPVMDSAFRNAHLDSFSTPFKMTWYVEMDNYINNGVYSDGSPMNYLTLYNTFVSNYGTELTTWGDELAYHHHFMTWNGSSWVQLTNGNLLNTTYDEHNNALDRMILDANFFPTDFRSGWLWESNQLQAWIEKWLLSDFSGPFGGNPTYFTYHPSPTDYTQVGNMNHWMSGCDGGPNSTNISAAFAQAASTGKPVIYCWFGHDRENMSGYLNTLQPLLTSASTTSSVPFRYATAKQALQAVMNTTDTTPPTLNVAKGSGDAFNITSNEPVWNNAPYVAARYIASSGLRYSHTPATSAGTNAWTAQVPDQQTWTIATPGEKYPLVGVTASSAKPGNPATYAIDGNDTTYWDSYDLPQWIYVDLGSIQPVPLLTVHFYDLDPRTYTYSIDASTDGSTWTEIVASTTVHGLATHTLSPAIDMRYARVNITAASIGSWAHIFEIVLYKTAPTTTTETGYLQQVGVGAGDLAGNTAVGSNIILPMADLALTKTSTPASLRLGAGNLTYNLTVANHGPSSASGVTLVDNLPAGLTLVSVNPSQGQCPNNAPVTCNLGNLANGASATVSIVVTPLAENTYINTASVSASTVDLNQANNTASVSTFVGNPVVYAVIAIDTEADNNHPMGTLHTIFDVHNYQRVGSVCSSFVAEYSDNGSSWTAYTDGTAFNFSVIPNGQTDPVTSFSCGYNNAYGLDDYARAVRFTVPSDGNYDVRLQLSVVGSPPDTNISVVPDLGGNPDTAHPLSTFIAHASSIVSGDYVVIGSNLPLQASVSYWWVANRQSSGDDNNQFAVYQSSTTSSNTFSQIMDLGFRNATTDSDGHSFKMSWFMEMDNFINNGLYADGRSMNYLTLYNELMNNWGNEVRSYGDEIAYHHHFMYWDGTQWQMGGQEQADTGPYDEHNNALDRMVLDAGFFPTDFRSGWLNNHNQLQAWLEKWMLADYGAFWSTWEPYHPSVTDYTQVGNMNHWIANCPGGPSQDGVNAAFAQAIADNRPVIYCIYFHERDDMRGAVASLHSYLTTAASANPGIPFKYATAKEAMQVIMHTTDTTPPTLSITSAAGDNYTITSNETLWGSSPYVAVRYGEGTSAVYQHIAATATETPNTWTVNLPPMNGQLMLNQVGAGANDLSGNSAVANFSIRHLALQPGWNLVSIPLHPLNPDPQAVLASLGSNYDIVYAWNGPTQSWLVFDRTAPAPVNTLTSMDCTHGYWIHITASSAVQLDVMGTTPSTTNISLSPGWNLVGYPASSAGSLPDVLKDHGVGTNFSMVFAYHAYETGLEWKIFDPLAPPDVNTLKSLTPGWGYWIQVSSASVWQVAY